MKKILLAFDGANFSEGAFEFARRINEKQPVLLTGVFLPQVDYANMWSYAGAGTASIMIPLIEGGETEEIQKNIEKFENRCKECGIEFRVHKHFYDFAMPELKRESRFADLLVLGSESFYSNLGKNEPNLYMRDALHAVECPVIVVPEKFEFPESNILAYDGSESSVYAIRQFAYLFPELCNNPSLLVYANADSEKSFPDKTYIEELTARHFKDFSFFKFEANSRKYFASWIAEKKTSLLITGAFGRSALSQLLKRSFVSDVIAEHKLPVFITHR
jgi:nucleotide-binding universal stress UspA family protein